MLWQIRDWAALEFLTSRGELRIVTATTSFALSNSNPCIPSDSAGTLVGGFLVGIGTRLGNGCSKLLSIFFPV